MSIQTHPSNMFVETGPITFGEIFPDEQSFLHNKNEQTTTPFARVKLLIDTGANISGIDSSIINGVGLPGYNDSYAVNGVGGIHVKKRYRCVLFLKIFGLKGLPIDILEGDFSESPYDGVIGRDVLQFCTFSYNGPSNSFQLKADNF